MCPWVGPHAPSFGRQLWGLPSRVEYLSPQGVLLPLVYGTTASPLWFELGMQVRIRTNSVEFEFAPNSHELVDPLEFEFEPKFLVIF